MCQKFASAIGGTTDCPPGIGWPTPRAPLKICTIIVHAVVYSQASFFEVLKFEIFGGSKNRLQVCQNDALQQSPFPSA
jgi:hypothetical protein